MIIYLALYIMILFSTIKQVIEMWYCKMCLTSHNSHINWVFFQVHNNNCFTDCGSTGSHYGEYWGDNIHQTRKMFTSEEGRWNRKLSWYKNHRLLFMSFFFCSVFVVITNYKIIKLKFFYLKYFRFLIKREELISALIARISYREL